MVVDDQNRLVVHSDTSLTTEVKDYSGFPPVVAIRAGKTGNFDYVDQETS